MPDRPVTPEQTIQRLRELNQSATPAPWHPFHVDDFHAMNCYGVTTDPDFERREDFIGASEGDDATCRRIVALTLYQATRVVCHADGLWDHNALLIANARNHLRALLDVAEAAQTMCSVETVYPGDWVNLRATLARLSGERPR